MIIISCRWIEYYHRSGIRDRLCGYPSRSPVNQALDTALCAQPAISRLALAAAGPTSRSLSPQPRDFVFRAVKIYL